MPYSINQSIWNQFSWDHSWWGRAKPGFHTNIWFTTTEAAFSISDDRLSWFNQLLNCTLNVSTFLYSTRWCVAATLPGMWDRTVTIGSAGKTFSVTGWKLGWSIGPQHLIQCLCMVHQNCNATCPTPLQVMTFVRFPTFQYIAFLWFIWYAGDKEICFNRNKVRR